MTLAAKPRCRAEEILAHEETVREVISVDRNPRGARGAHDGLLGLWRLIRTLRSHRFDAAVLLHKSASLAFATWAAGIPSRRATELECSVGSSIGDHLPRSRYIGATGRWNVPRCSCKVRTWRWVRPSHTSKSHRSARVAVQRRLDRLNRPLVVLGIGSSEPMRQWGASTFRSPGAGAD